MNVRVFEPRAETARDPMEGPVVFATPDKAYASCFLVPSDDSWVKIGRFASDGAAGSWYYVVSDRERFEKADTGGAIYSLPADSFESDPYKNMPGVEWVSAKAVRPTEKEEFSSGFNAMQESGVDIFFVDQGTFVAIEDSDDQGESIIGSLKPSLDCNTSNVIHRQSTV